MNKIRSTIDWLGAASRRFFGLITLVLVFGTLDTSMALAAPTPTPPPVPTFTPDYSMIDKSGAQHLVGGLLSKGEGTTIWILWAAAAVFAIVGVLVLVFKAKRAPWFFGLAIVLAILAGGGLDAILKMIRNITT
jgi:hypothetical protein